MDTEEAEEEQTTNDTWFGRTKSGRMDGWTGGFPKQEKRKFSENDEDRDDDQKPQVKQASGKHLHKGASF